MRKLFTLKIALIIYCGVQAQSYQLWITAAAGGINDRGTILTADSAGNNFHVVYHCDSTGSMPVGDLVEADNGNLYGVTENGGCADSCVIYEYDPESGIFTDIHDFACSGDSGVGTISGLIRGADGNLYGVCPHGGPGLFPNYGVIYSVWPADNSYHVLYSFMDSSGSIPIAGLMQLSNGKFYGTTNQGGRYQMGVIFSFDPVTSAYSVLHHFSDTTGAVSYLGVLVQAANGKLYGTTSLGGLYGYGGIYSLDLAGNVYTPEHDFDSTNGSGAYCVLMQATDGKLYGTTPYGIVNQYGTLFSFDPSNNSFSSLHHFNIADGSTPQRALSQPGGSRLFGTTTYGGTSGNGVIFSYDISIDSFAVVYEFDGITGGNPDCGVLEYVPKTITRVNEVNKTAELILSPNPTTSSVSITVSEDLIGANATLSDVTGRKVAAVQLTTYHLQLTTSDFESGVYFITVSASDGRSVSKKLIIEK